MDGYDLTDAAGAIHRFVVDDLSNWYVRVNRRRFWGSEDTMEKRTAYDTLSEALGTVALLCAPMVPFHSEHIFQGLGHEVSPGSVHFQPFPFQDPSLVDKELERRMELVKRIVDLGRAARGLRNMKIRQPLSRAVIKGSEVLGPGLESIIRSELNVREVAFEDDLSTYFETTAEPDPKKLGPKLKAASAPVRDALLAIGPRELANRMISGGIHITVHGTEYHIERDDMRFHEVLPERWAMGSEGELEVLLDLEITDELWNEGIAREVVRRVQTMRKDMNLPYDARISLTMTGEGKLLSAVDHYRSYIMSETLSDSLSFDEGVEGTEWELDDGRIVISARILKG
jgi:isoleucyl-tRNA synthetase